ncbi:MAG: transposase [Deltaproteobacteria bacterium]|nr:transposase [Deltaproteobacteria bacterium]
MRKNARRSVGVREVKRLGENDRWVDWVKSKEIPVWMDLAQWLAMPALFRVREIHLVIDIAGFRTRSVTVATTLLDAGTFPAEAFAELYRRRWLAEVGLRDAKITLGMDVLRCKSPEMVERELRVIAIAYNLVRAMMLEAAGASGAPASRVSFQGALVAIRQWAPILAASTDLATHDRICAEMLTAIARDLVPDRPNRLEPRATKRRPKNYQRLTKPRGEFREAQHRSKYTRPLS